MLVCHHLLGEFVNDAVEGLDVRGHCEELRAQVSRLVLELPHVQLEFILVGLLQRRFYVGCLRF